MKKVSVVVPVYNSQEYLRECLDSLVNQTLEEIEIILVNDGSTDSSGDIMEEYRTLYPDKVVVYTKSNGGQASARNIGIELAQGQYIGFVDSDDSVAREMYKKMYATAERSKCDYVECEYKYIQIEDEMEKELPCYGNVRAYSSTKEMFIDPLVSPWNKLYKSSVLKDKIRFPEGVIYEDTAFFVKSIPYISKMEYVPEALVYHYLRQNSTMNSRKDKKVGDIFTVLQDIIDYYKEQHFYEEYAQELEYFCVKILLCSSLQRIAIVQNKALQKEYIHRTLQMIKANFREYRANDYFHRGITGMYMRCVNVVTINLFVWIWKMRNAGK